MELHPNCSLPDASSIETFVSSPRQEPAHCEHHTQGGSSAFSLYLSVCLSLYPCVPVSLYPCIPLSLYSCILVSLCPAMPLSLYPSVPQSLCPSVPRPLAKAAAGYTDGWDSCSILHAPQMKMEAKSLMNLSKVLAQQMRNDFVVQPHGIQIRPLLPWVTSCTWLSAEVNEPLSAPAQGRSSVAPGWLREQGTPRCSWRGHPPFHGHVV